MVPINGCTSRIGEGAVALSSQLRSLDAALVRRLSRKTALRRGLVEPVNSAEIAIRDAPQPSVYLYGRWIWPMSLLFATAFLALAGYGRGFPVLHIVLGIFWALNALFWFARSRGVERSPHVGEADHSR